MKSSIDERYVLELRFLLTMRTSRLKDHDHSAGGPWIHYTAGSPDCSERPRAVERETSELNIDYFAAFIRELDKTTSAAGCRIRAVGFEEIVKEIIAASGLKS